MWTKIDQPSRRRTSRAITIGFHLDAIAKCIGLAQPRAIRVGNPASGLRFITTGKQRSAGSLLDHSI